MKIVIKRLKNHLEIFKHIVSRKEIIINYQMGKVGSSSVAKFLRVNNVFEWHVHRFYDTPVHKKNGKKNVILKVLDLLLLKLVLIFCPKIRVISGFRDPIARDISMFFHNIDRYYKEKDISTKETKEAIKFFNENFEVGSSLDWFHSEMNRAFNINVFDHEMLHENGYMEFSKGKVKFFIYDIRYLSQLNLEISNFLGVDGYVTINDNVASNKHYNQAYKNFQNQYLLDRVLLERLAESQYMNFFYLDSDRNEILNKWNNVS